MTDFSRGDYADLPASTTDLENNYSAPDLTAIASNDNSTYALQTANNEIAIHQYKKTVTGQKTNILWSGKSSLAPSESPVIMEVYNVNDTVWEELDRDDATAADTDFDLAYNGLVAADYLDTGVITFRVYQSSIVATPCILCGTLGASNLPTVQDSINYIHICGANAISATESPVALRIPTDGVIDFLRVYAVSGPGDGVTWTFTVWVNNGAKSTDVVATIAGAGSGVIGRNTANTAPVSAGDTVSIKVVVTGGTAATSSASWGIRFTSNTAGETILTSGSRITGLSTTDTQYLMCAGNGGSNGIMATEAAGQFVAPVSGTFKKMYVYLSAAPGTGVTRTFTMNVGGTPSSLSVAIAHPATNNSDVHDCHVNAGDLVSVSSAVSASAAAANFRMALIFVADTTGEFMLISHLGTASYNNASNRYSLVTADIFTMATTGGIAQAQAPAPMSFTATAIYGNLTTSPATGNVDLALAVGGTATALLANATGSGVISATGSVAITAEDKITFETVPHSTPTVGPVSISVRGVA